MDPSMKITTSSLNDNNNTTWAKSTRLYLLRKSKLGYINGKISSPLLSDPSYEEWEVNDKIVMSWLLDSMDSSIAEGFILLNMAKEVWDALEEIYIEGHNLARVYLLQQDIMKVNKGEQPFHVCLSHLKWMWDELAQHHPLVLDLETQKQRLEKDKIFKILSGLSQKFDHLCSQILMSSPLPSFNTVCSIIRREETRRKVMSSEADC